MAVRSIPAFALFALSLFLPSTAFADRVSGTLTSTYMIVEDTDLIGDVTCNVAANTACFAFAAPNVELRLNGFTITGRGDATTGCAGGAAAGEAGVATANMVGVTIRGPGLIQRFRGDGVTVGGSTNVRVADLTLSTNCMSGVRILGTSFGTLIEGNTAIRNGSSNAGLLCGGI
jgi:hypothetical protein